MWTRIREIRTLPGPKRRNHTGNVCGMIRFQRRSGITVNMPTPEDLRRITEHSKTIVSRAKATVEIAKETVHTATELCMYVERANNRRVGRARKTVRKGLSSGI